MVAVCKVGGCCRLAHSTDEGEKQRYSGLHQWNFRPQEDGNLVIHGPGAGGSEVSLRSALRGVATVQTRIEGAWHNVFIRPVVEGS